MDLKDYYLPQFKIKHARAGEGAFEIVDIESSIDYQFKINERFGIFTDMKKDNFRIRCIKIVILSAKTVISEETIMTSESTN